MYSINNINKISVEEMLTQPVGTPIKHRGISFNDLANAVEEFGDGTKRIYPNLPGTELFQEFGAESSVILQNN